MWPSLSFSLACTALCPSKALQQTQQSGYHSLLLLANRGRFISSDWVISGSAHVITPEEQATAILLFLPDISWTGGKVTPWENIGLQHGNPILTWHVFNSAVPSVGADFMQDALAFNSLMRLAKLPRQLCNAVHSVHSHSSSPKIDNQVVLIASNLYSTSHWLASWLQLCLFHRRSAITMDCLTICGSECKYCVLLYNQSSLNTQWHLRRECGQATASSHPVSPHHLLCRFNERLAAQAKHWSVLNNFS